MSIDLAKLVARLELQSSQFQSELEKTNKKLLGFERQSSKSLRNIEKQAQEFGKSLSSAARTANSAFALLAGMGLKKAFQSVFTETAANSREFADALTNVKSAAKDLLSSKDGAPAAAAAMNEFAETLKDPAVVSAADNLTSTLIRGFAAITTGIAKTIGGLQVLLGMTGNEVENIGRQIAEIEDKIARTRIAAARGGFDPTKQIAELERRRLELSALQMKAIDRGPTPRATSLGFDTFLPGGLPGFEVGELDVSGELTKQMAEFQRLQEIVPVDDLQEKMTAFVDTIKGGIEEGITNTSQQASDSIEQLSDQLGQSIGVAKKWSDEWSVAGDQAARNMQDAFADFLFDPFSDGLKGMLRGFIDVLRRMLAEATAAQVFKQLFGETSEGGNGLVNVLRSFFGAGSASSGVSGPRAMGGSVSAGHSYLVGERGPEIFTANHSGAIVPNHKLGGAAAPVINQNISGVGLTQEQLAVVMDRNNRQLIQMIQRAQSQSGQQVMVF